MLAGELYHANDPELEADRSAAAGWMVRYNAALSASDAERLSLGGSDWQRPETAR
jgi:maltose O-acetyltransferase